MSSEDELLDGYKWLTQAYERAATLKTASTAYNNTNQRLVVSERVRLEFNRYGMVPEKSAITRRVVGSKRDVIKKKDVIDVPAGTEVIFYRQPGQANQGVSIATLYLPGEQVTYRQSENLRRVRL